MSEEGRGNVVDVVLRCDMCGLEHKLTLQWDSVEEKWTITKKNESCIIYVDPRE